MRNHARMQSIMLLLIGLLAAGSPAQTVREVPDGVEHAPVNTTCPVTTDEEVDPRFVLDYEGQQIGFCCKKCLTKFRQDPAAYLSALAGLTATQPGGLQPPGTDQIARGESEVAGSAAHAIHEAEPDHGESGHDHEHGVNEATLLDWLGKFHPPATHLPIGLLAGAVVAELGMILSRRVWFRHAAGFCLSLATVGAVVTATLGWLAGGFVLWDADWVQATHRWLGTGTAVMSVITLASFARMVRHSGVGRDVLWYRACLFFTASLIGAAGFFGGALVFGINHYAW